MKDLILLVADLDTENVLLGLLPRLRQVCGTRDFTFEIKRHPYRDAGCLSGSVDFLRPFCNHFRHALVVFDKEGSGQERNQREEIEAQLESDLTSNGWAEGNAKVIAINPEVENWMWINSPRISNALDWQESTPLFDWLKEQGWLEGGAEKPGRPKEAMVAVLKKTRKARSASIYKNIASSTSFKGCTDEAFLKMLHTLKAWFMPEED